MSGVSLQRVVKHNDDTAAAQSNPSSSSSNGITNNGSSSASAINEPAVTSHSARTPNLADTFVLLFNAVKVLQDNKEKESISSMPEVHKSVSILIESYSKAMNYTSKAKQAEFLVDIGFPNVSKVILLKLSELFPNLLSFDREKDDPNMKNQDSVELSKAQDLFLLLVTAMVNYSKRCDIMIERLANIGCVPMFLDMFGKLKDCTDTEAVSSNQRRSCDLKGMPKRTIILVNVQGILLCLSKRIPVRPIFHEHNAVQALLPMMEHRVTILATLTLLILAYIINEDYNFLILAHKGPIEYLIFLIDKATNAPNHKAMGGSNIELAEGLAQIAINDNNKKLIVTNGAIPILTRMLSDARDEEEQIAAANVLWVLAFDQENSKSMQDDEHCMAELRKLKENQSRDVQRVASGALWEIEGKRSKLADSDGTSILPKVASRALPSMHEEKAKKKKKMLMKNSRSVPADDQELATDVKQEPETHIMISYQWDVQNVMIEVKNKLQSAGFKVWMDLEQMGGSTLEAMARAVENSAVVLVGVSQKYKESSNCRSEAEYAFQLKKDIVPLMMQTSYRADGWLGMLMGSKLWIDFSRGQERLQTSCEELYKELGFRGIMGETQLQEAKPVQAVEKPLSTQQQNNTGQQENSNNPQQSNNLHENTKQQQQQQPKQDISGWTSADVRIWMNGFGLSVKIKRMEKKLNGTMLTLLHSFKNEVSPEYFYSSIKTDFGFDTLDALIFKKELEKLLG